MLFILVSKLLINITDVIIYDQDTQNIYQSHLYCCFCIHCTAADTCMQFFRAYYDGNGVIVYELRRIAKHYVISGQFFLNLLASFPMQVSACLFYLFFWKYLF